MKSIVHMGLWCLLCISLYLNYVQATQNENSTDVKPPLTTATLDSSCDENKDVSYAVCTSGNRMYRLLTYDVDKDQVIFECYQACNETYSTPSDVHSCEVGCRSGVQVGIERQRELNDFESQESSLMHRAQMQQMISHWMFEMLAGFDVFNDWYDSGLEDHNENTYVVIEQSDNQLRISSYRIGEMRPSSLATPDNSAEAEAQNPYVETDDSDFEPCYSKMSYSRLLVCMLLMSSGLFLIWLTCSTVTTAPKRRVDSKKNEQEEIGDEKMTLKMLLAYHPQGPAPVHVSSKMGDDEKMLLA